MDEQTTTAVANASNTQTRPSITFESLTFSDGSVVHLQPDDIVVFVGPNNAGKSAALRELEVHFGPPVVQTVIKSATLRRDGTAVQLREFLDTQARKTGDASNPQYQGYRYSINAQSIESWWQSNISPLRQLFCTRIATESRIIDSNAQASFDVLNAQPSHPIHLLYSDDRVEARISTYFRKAFGKDLILFRTGGSQLPLLVGERPLPAHGEDRVSATFVQRLRDTTVPLSEQGDGMRSFASVILHLLAPQSPSILLLDEPEAFLHPPQARLLGDFIAKERPAGSQLFVATHSSDVLQGLLNGAPENLRVLRLQRDGNVNRVKELDKKLAKAITADPLMKFSSVLSGIFHQRVVICEADSDCTFYNALLELPSVHGVTQPDVLFIHAGGKHRMSELAKALHALDVKIDVIADIDVLNDLTVLQRLVMSMGGDWESVAAVAVPLKSAIEQHKPWLNATEVANAIRKVLEGTPSSGEFPKQTRSAIEGLFRKASPWDAVKDAGEAAIPAGQATQQFASLRNICGAFGLWIVPVGEMEGFCKATGGHGPKWVQEVLKNYDLGQAAELITARAFMSKIWNSPQPPRQLSAS